MAFYTFSIEDSQIISYFLINFIYYKMDNFGLVLILVLIILIFISAFFSGSETSITAINQIKLDSAAESGQKAARRVNSLRNKINEVLGVILIGNNLVNISASAF